MRIIPRNSNVNIWMTSQSGALGGAILGMVSTGIYPDLQTAIDTVVQYTRCFSLDPAVHTYYERKLSRFRDAQQNLRNGI